MSNALGLTLQGVKYIFVTENNADEICVVQAYTFNLIARKKKKNKRQIYDWELRFDVIGCKIHICYRKYIAAFFLFFFSYMVQIQAKCEKKKKKKGSNTTCQMLWV